MENFEADGNAKQKSSVQGASKVRKVVNPGLKRRNVVSGNRSVLDGQINRRQKNLDSKNEAQDNEGR